MDSDTVGGGGGAPPLLTGNRYVKIWVQCRKERGGTALKIIVISCTTLSSTLTGALLLQPTGALKQAPGPPRRNN